MRKRFELGFTLAEVLITVGILGVIAALTMPSVVTSVQDKKNGAALGRSVEAIESGCQMMIQEMNESQNALNNGKIFMGHFNIGRTLNGNSTSSATSSISGKNLFYNDTARSYFNVSSMTTASITAYNDKVTSYDGGTPSPGLSTLVNKYAVSSKFGAYYGVQTPSSYEANFDDPIVGYVYIDVNGDSNPNRYGRDIFYFGLTDRCHMIPAGTQRMKDLLSIPLASDTGGCKGGNNVNGLSCTARVVNEGYKINY